LRFSGRRAHRPVSGLCQLNLRALCGSSLQRPISGWQFGSLSAGTQAGGPAGPNPSTIRQVNELLQRQIGRLVSFEDRQDSFRRQKGMRQGRSSKITYIDGDKGELLYRGYPIEQLAESLNFIACFTASCRPTASSESSETLLLTTRC
jgi:Citrate synthase, C-terminal domain